jgi:hypothetical protein
MALRLERLLHLSDLTLARLVPVLALHGSAALRAVRAAHAGLIAPRGDPVRNGPRTAGRHRTGRRRRTADHHRTDRRRIAGPRRMGCHPTADPRRRPPTAGRGRTGHRRTADRHRRTGRPRVPDCRTDRRRTPSRGSRTRPWPRPPPEPYCSERPLHPRPPRPPRCSCCQPRRYPCPPDCSSDQSLWPCSRSLSLSFCQLSLPCSRPRRPRCSSLPMPACHLPLLWVLSVALAKTFHTRD